MFRLLCLACCLLSFASPAGAVVIVQEGDVYDELVVSDPEFLMTGGSVNRLVLGGITNAVVEGGVIGAENDEEAILMLGSDHLTIRGGMVRRTLTSNNPGIIISEQGNPVISLDGFHFRLRDAGFPEGNQWRIQGWLMDGTFVNIVYFHALRASAATVEFNIIPSDTPPGDTDGDWDVDISDLNTIRNNFGNEGPGDLDESGTVDVADLNLVRNHFGYGSDFTLDSSMAVPLNAAVPEPTSLGLILVMTMVLLLPKLRAVRR